MTRERPPLGGIIPEANRQEEGGVLVIRKNLAIHGAFEVGVHLDLAELVNITHCILKHGALLSVREVVRSRNLALKLPDLLLPVGYEAFCGTLL